MTKEELKKAMTEAGMDAAALATVDALDVSADVERMAIELTAEKGKNAQIVTDKNRYKGERDTARTDLEAAKNSNLSVDEKWQTQIDTIKQELADEKAAGVKKEEAAATATRNGELAKIGAMIKTVEGVDASVVGSLVNSATTDFEDFGNAEAVADIVKGINERNPALIAATVAEGSGGQHQGGGGGVGDGPKTIADAMAAAYAK